MARTTLVVVHFVVTVLILSGHAVVSRITEPHSPVLNALSGIPEVAQALSFNRRKWIEFNPNDTRLTESSDELRSPTKGSCFRDVLRLVTSLNQKWALEFVDAFGKPESGLLTGRFTWTGNYEECIGAAAPATNFSFGFKGQYCWVNIQPKMDALPAGTSFKIGTCIPNSCDSRRIMKHYYDLINFFEKIPYVGRLVENGTLAGISCVPNHVDWSTGSVACLFFCFLVASIVTIATVWDLLGKSPKPVKSRGRTLARTESNGTVQNGSTVNGTVHNETEEQSAENGGVHNGSTHGVAEGDVTLIGEDDGHVLISSDRERTRSDFSRKVLDILQCFSAVKNGSAIMDTSKKSGQLDCIHGIRFLSITWVILGHTFFFCVGQVGNPTKILEIMDMWHFQAVIQALFSVDTFFFLSGFLLAYLVLKDKATPKSFGAWVYFYVHRYIRLTPVYAIVLAFWSSTWNYLGEGPFWPYDNPQSDICRDNWWMNLLYVNNFGSLTEMCMGWSWYLSNDMQFYIVSPLFLVTLTRWPILGYIISGVTIVASWFATFFVSYGNDMLVLFEGNMGEMNLADKNNPTVKIFDLIYEKPYCRIGPYVIGILVAYIYLKTRESKRAAHKCFLALGWASASTCALAVVYGLYHSHLNTVGSAFFTALSKSAWGLCLGWVVFACLSGYGGPINSLLSMRYLFPLSRLTYCAYLVHPLIMYWYYDTLKDMFYLNLTFMTFAYLAFLMLAFGFAFIISLLFESPIVGLEKQLRKLLK